MDMEQKSKATNSKSKKRLFMLLLAGMLLITLALAGNKWIGQIQEYKDNMHMHQQEIDELKTRIKVLEKGNDISAGIGRALVLTDWNVEIPLNDNSSYFSTSYNNGYYYIHSSVSGCYSDGRDIADSTVVAVAAISRNKTEDIITSDGFMGDKSWIGKTWGTYYSSIKNGKWNASKVIDEYVYNISGPQMSCGNPETATGKSANQKHQMLSEEVVLLMNELRLRNK
jgi:hypothetical protein